MTTKRNQEKSALLVQALLAVCLCCPLGATGLESDPPPPLVLLIDKVSLDQSAMPSPSANSAGTAKEVFWLLTTSLLTFGVPLLDLPRVLEEGGADERSARLCLASWKAILDGPQPWLKSADLQEFVMQTIRDEVTRLVDHKARPVTVELAAPDSNNSARAEAINEIGIRLAASSLALAEVSMSVEPSQSGCAADFRARANLQVQSIGAEKGNPPLGSSPPLATLGKSQTVDVHDWATDPELGRQALRLALVQLTQAIIKAYPWPQ